ncbi:hypothetical protein [Jiulongibacter sediminis]|uniref:Anti-sigma factor n=1 Tax=Jiulongibacter sediminis TaxID=1605367 RepID=A0A0P7C1L0_9BACT|nr:hypothetical protein [Jiulongibacter sediminis]KPM47902.1 hypothetical protein AFM12_11760 [Jiulongibacter sediminis]TBX24084.1 hypothetical protein TK44_11770 [Jiulongibacter sediminis]
MDKLKDFIENNRRSFDTAEVSEGLWDKIELGLNAGGTIPLKSKPWFRMGIAASVAILLSLGYVAGKYSRPIKEHKEIINLSPRYGAEMVRFSSSVNEKKKQLNTFQDVNPGLVEQFNEDLKALDESYGELKNELPNNPNQEIILDQMIENLNWQLELLDRQLDVIKKEQEQEKDDMVLSPFEMEEEVPVQFV